MVLGAIFVVLSIIFGSVYLYGLRIFQRIQFRKFPGPRPEWLLGSISTLRGPEGQHKAYQKWGAEYGPGPHVIHLAGRPTLSITEPELARKILYGGVRPNFGGNSVMPEHIRRKVLHSILLVSGQKWRDLRAAWQPMFFTGSLEGYMGIMDQSAQRLVAEMGWGVEKGVVDVQRPIQDMTLSVVGQSAFGLDLHCQKADEAEISDSERARSDRLREALQRFFVSPSGSNWVRAATVLPVLLPVFRFLAPRFPDKTLLKVQRQLILARNEVEGVVQALVEEHENTAGLPASDSGGSAKHAGLHIHANGSTGGAGPPPATLRRGVAPGSFIDLLVKRGGDGAGQKFSQECIVQQALTMLLAGYETTANALTFTIYLLSQSCNSEKQAKLVKEIDALGKEWTPSYDELEEKLPYMDAVINESLRLYPPAFITLRETETDLNVDGYDVKKGTWVAVSPYVIQNDPRVWGSDVGVFIPERWLSQDPVEVKKAKKGFFAFGAGSRVCPGSRFAIIEIKLALIRIFRAFTLELCPNQEPLAIRDSITISAKKGVLVKPSPRQYS